MHNGLFYRFTQVKFLKETVSGTLDVLQGCKNLYISCFLPRSNIAYSSRGVHEILILNFSNALHIMATCVSSHCVPAVWAGRCNLKSKSKKRISTSMPGPQGSGT